MKRPSKLSLAALLLLAACSARPAKLAPTAGSGSRVRTSSPPAASLADAAVERKPDAASLEAAVPPPTCDTGADCATRGLQAFDARHYLEAHQLFERACELNDALGCKWLAGSLEGANDARIPVDAARVAPVMEKACQLGEMQACWMLGNGYLYGRRTGVVTPNPERAVQLYQKGCDGGDDGSCASLADCYEQGEGVAKDKRLAKKYRKRAAQLGYVGE